MLPFRIPGLLLLLLPIAEIYAFIEVGGRIGAGWTLLWVVASAVMGVWLLRWHGMSTMQRVQAAMLRGELPARAMLDGTLLFFSAVLLIIPGFITDLLGLLLLLPPLRWLLLRRFARRFAPFPPGHEPHFRRSDTIEGEFQREDERTERSRLE